MRAEPTQRRRRRSEAQEDAGTFRTKTLKEGVCSMLTQGLGPRRVIGDIQPRWSATQPNVDATGDEVSRNAEQDGAKLVRGGAPLCDSPTSNSRVGKHSNLQVSALRRTGLDNRSNRERLSKLMCLREGHLHAEVTFQPGPTSRSLTAAFSSPAAGAEVAVLRMRKLRQRLAWPESS